MLVHHHHLEIPPELVISNVGEIVIAHEPSRELSLFVYPVTSLAPERWVYRMMTDGAGLQARYEDQEIGEQRCRRVTSTHDTFRRVILFIETRDGSEGWLPLLLFAKDGRHDDLLETIAASVRATRVHPFQMWIE